MRQSHQASIGARTTCARCGATGRRGVPSKAKKATICPECAASEVIEAALTQIGVPLKTDSAREWWQ